MIYIQQVKLNLGQRMQLIHLQLFAFSVIKQLEASQERVMLRLTAVLLQPPLDILHNRGFAHPSTF